MLATKDTATFYDYISFDDWWNDTVDSLIGGPRWKEEDLKELSKSAWLASREKFPCK
jgi:hypothetical protein